MKKEQDYSEFVKKNHKELERKKELLEAQAEEECIVCDQVITQISSTPHVCKSCEDKALRGEKLNNDE